MRSRGALKVVGQVVDDRRKRRLAGAALEDFGGDGVGLEDALRREQHPAALRLVVRQPDAARQPRLRVARYRIAFGHPASKFCVHAAVCAFTARVIRHSAGQKAWIDREKCDASDDEHSGARQPSRWFWRLPAQAQDYPNKPVTFITPAAAGNSPDVVTRIVADKLTQIWKQQIVVINRPGAGGLIAAQAAAALPKDGYSLYMTQASTWTVLPIQQEGKMPVDLHKAFVPIGMVGEQPIAVGVNKDVKANNVAELIAARQQARRTACCSPPPTAAAKRI